MQFDAVDFLSGLFSLRGTETGAVATPDRIDLRVQGAETDAVKGVPDHFVELDLDDRLADWVEIHAEGRVSLVHPDHVDDLIVDLPEPCPNCGGIVVWWDLLGGTHCEQCEPRTVAQRLRERAEQLRERYSVSESGEKTFGGLLTASQYADTILIG